MPSWAELRLALSGILKLARFDPDFARFFDQSPAGALRSFWVVGAVIVYNFLVSRFDAHPEVASEVRYFLAVGVGDLVACTLLPVALLSLAPILQREAEVPGAIAAYNWMNLLSIALAAPLNFLNWNDASPSVLFSLWLVYLMVMLAFEAFLLRHTLRVALPIAIGLAGADIFISQFVVYPLLVQAGSQ